MNERKEGKGAKRDRLAIGRCVRGLCRGAPATAMVALLGAACADAPGSESTTWHASPIEETRPLFSQSIPPSEFAERLGRVYDAIGPNAVAVIQGAPSTMGSVTFRQSNEFYHLTGIASPHAYVILDGAQREASLYLMPRDERGEYSEGKVLSAEDADLIRASSAIDHVHPLNDLVGHLQGWRGRAEQVYAPLAPPELRSTTRGSATRTVQNAAADPLDGRPARHERFLSELARELGGVQIRDLNPILDEMRMIKSEREIQLVRASSRLHGLAILEAMRASETGVSEADIEAVARFVFWRHGAMGSAYNALSHIGANAYMNHYHAGVRVSLDGDMVLLDYGADYEYYTSDMGRMWPVNGTFNDVQRELYGFYLGFYEAILDRIRPHVTAQQVKLEALEEIDRLLASWEFSRPTYKQAAHDFVEAYREGAQNPATRLGHSVGMAVHDPFPNSGELLPGMIFVIEPQFRVPDEKIYIRLEDTILLTEDGVEIITDFVPRDIDSIERLVRQEGMLQHYRRLMSEDGEFLAEAERLIAAAGSR